MDLKNIKQYETNFKNEKTKTCSQDAVVKMLGLSDEIWCRLYCLLKSTPYS